MTEDGAKLFKGPKLCKIIGYSYWIVQFDSDITFGLPGAILKIFNEMSDSNYRV